MTETNEKPSLPIVGNDLLIADAQSFARGQGFAVDRADRQAAIAKALAADLPPALDLSPPPPRHRPGGGFALIAELRVGRGALYGRMDILAGTGERE